MLRIRLQRRGKNKYATYRVVVADQHAPIKGKFMADLGTYNPHTNEFKVDAASAAAWMAKGAQPSPTIHNLMVTHGLLKAAKVTIWKVPKQAAATVDAPAVS